MHLGLSKDCEDYQKTIEHESNRNSICVCDNERTGEEDFVTPLRHFTLPPLLGITRYIYLGYSSIAALSLGKHNVVVGAKLASADEIIYIKIKVGKLLPGGVIDDEHDPPKWLDIPSDVLKNNKVQLKWNQRTIELADLDVPRGHLLTGLHFKLGKNGNIKLGIVSKLFDIDTAYAIDLFNPPFGNDEHGTPTEIEENVEREFIDNRDLKLPPLNEQTNRIEKNKNLNFTLSSFKYDLGQTTVPFLDIQEVCSEEIPSPMSGASLYYKYTDGYAGYLGIGLKTYNISVELESAAPLTRERIKAIYDKLANNTKSKPIKLR